MKGNLRAAVAAALLAGGMAPVWAQKLMSMPSTSMEPTYHSGSQVWVNLLVMITDDPVRGDVVVYRPPTGDGWFISRVVGQPGDVVAYGSDRRLTLNGRAVPTDLTKERLPALEKYLGRTVAVYVEALPGARHRVVFPAPGSEPPILRYDALEHEPTCQVSREAFVCTVPKGRYFLMGDHRDNARDSRYLGFIAREAIGGRVSTGDSP